VDADRLDPISREVAREVRRNLPRLARHMRSDPRPGGEPHAIALRAPREAGDGLALIVDTGERGRVRVGFGNWSREYRTPEEGGRETELAAALDAIEDIALGRATTYTLFRDGKFQECGLLRDERDEARLLSRLARGMRIELADWSGEHDAVYER
jgi:hypothetical protein